MNNESSRPVRITFNISLLVIIFLYVVLCSCNKSDNKKQLNGLLFSAVLRNDEAVVRNLLTKGADANARDDNGCTPLVRAAWQGNLSITGALFENGADLNRTCNDDSEANPLKSASLAGHAEVVTFLLEKGADVNQKDKLGHSSLTSAIGSGRTAIVKLLLDKGAEVNIRYDYGDSPLIQATRAGNAAMVRMLLDKGADPRAMDDGRYTPLMYAVKEGFEDILKMLIEKGAFVNMRAGDGHTPIELARSKNKDNIVRILKEAGATEPKDPVDEEISRAKEKIASVRKNLENKGWEYIATSFDVLLFLKPSEIVSAGNGIYQVSTIDFYTASDKLEHIVMEINCLERRYRHISYQVEDINGKLIKTVPLDSYALADDGNVRDSSLVHPYYVRICQH